MVVLIESVVGIFLFTIIIVLDNCAGHTEGSYSVCRRLSPGNPEKMHGIGACGRTEEAFHQRGYCAEDRSYVGVYRSAFMDFEVF